MESSLTAASRRCRLQRSFIRTKPMILCTVAIVCALLVVCSGDSHRVSPQLPSFSELEIGKKTLLQPGGKTSCLLGDKFGFQVDRQDSDKLIIFFAGGGVCWDELSTKNKLCPMRASGSMVTEGMLLRDANAENKFSHFSMIVVSYCSGDLHLGNKKRDFPGPQGASVEHRGLTNFQAVLTWLVRQQQLGELASPLKELVVMGTSAGCYPAMLLTHTIASSLKYERAAVFVDSIEIILPRGVLSVVFQSFGTCEIFERLVSPAALRRCNQPDFDIADLFIELAGKTPDIPYAFTIAKTDLTQRRFYNALKRSSNPPVRASLSEEAELQNFYEIFQNFAKKIPNFVIYLINGPDHVYTNRPHYYSADALLSTGSSSYSGLKYKQWLEMMPLREVGDTIHSVCAGTVFDTIPIIGNTSHATGLHHGHKARPAVNREEGLTSCLQSINAATYVQQPHP